MEKEKIIVGHLHHFGGLTLIPVSRVSTDCCCSGNGCLCHAVKRPVAVVVASDAGLRVQKLNGTVSTAEELISEYPSIEQSLKQYS